MSKILVNVQIPSINQNYDIYIPDNLKVNSVAHLIEKAIVALSNYTYIHSGDMFLCWKEKEVLLDEESDFSSYGIENGDHLLLI